MEGVCESSDGEEYGNTIGYISIRDYAYDESNPLHYGYFDGGAQGGRGHVITGLNNEDIIRPEDEEEGQKADNEDGRHSREDVVRRQSVVLPKEYVVNRRFVALYDFIPENDNELELREGDIVYVSYKHGQGWLVAENSERTKTGLVPEEYVSVLEEDEGDKRGSHTKIDDQVHGDEEARPFYLTQMIVQNMTRAEDEWEDIEEVEDEEEIQAVERSIRGLGSW